MSGGNGNGNGRPARNAGGRVLEVKCPQCGQLTAYEGNPNRPFCSERCKLIDLGEWAEGNYAIPSEDAPGSEEGEG